MERRMTSVLASRRTLGIQTPNFMQQPFFPSRMEYRERTVVTVTCQVSPSGDVVDFAPSIGYHLRDRAEARQGVTGMSGFMSAVGRSKQELDTPSLVVDLPKMERNIVRMTERIIGYGVNWRPHTKGQKVPAIAHQLL